MSTNDVPGSNPDNNDELGMGAWAEHKDGSLLFVESTEGNRVIYSMFDMAKTPVVEYRDAMVTTAFEKTFGRDSDLGPWTWHDKTAFPWDRVIKSGVPDGARHAYAGDTMSAAQRVAESLRLRGEEMDRERATGRTDTTMRRSGGIWDKLSRAFAEMGR